MEGVDGGMQVGHILLPTDGPTRRLTTNQDLHNYSRLKNLLSCRRSTGLSSSKGPAPLQPSRHVDGHADFIQKANKVLVEIHKLRILSHTETVTFPTTTTSLRRIVIERTIVILETLLEALSNKLWIQPGRRQFTGCLCRLINNPVEEHKSLVLTAWKRQLKSLEAQPSSYALRTQRQAVSMHHSPSPVPRKRALHPTPNNTSSFMHIFLSFPIIQFQQVNYVAHRPSGRIRAHAMQKKIENA
ncbi:hypothetical protein V2G26_016063 [Clonostachys chloroleuca]